MADEVLDRDAAQGNLARCHINDGRAPPIFNSVFVGGFIHISCLHLATLRAQADGRVARTIARISASAFYNFNKKPAPY